MVRPADLVYEHGFKIEREVISRYRPWCPSCEGYITGDIELFSTAVEQMQQHARDIHNHNRLRATDERGVPL